MIPECFTWCDTVNFDLVNVIPLYNYYDVVNVIALYRCDDPELSVLYELFLPYESFFEKSAYNRFVANLNEREILFRCQFGFRKLHSTSMALKTLMEELEKCPDSNEYIIGHFIDFSKAFDAVDHVILLQKVKRLPMVSGESLYNGLIVISNTNGNMLLILV